VFFCSLEVSGTSATNGLLNPLYWEILGRPSTVQEQSQWHNRGYSDSDLTADQAQQIRAELLRNLHAPSGAATLSQVTERVMVHSFGAKPSPNFPFYKLLQKLALQPNSTYDSLISFTRTYFQDPSSSNSRQTMIRKAYVDSLGRPPTAGDLAYWQARSMELGSNYLDILKAGEQWVLSAGNEAAFATMIRWAFELEGRPTPTSAQITNIRLASQTTLRTFEGWRKFIRKF